MCSGPTTRIVRAPAPHRMHRRRCATGTSIRYSSKRPRVRRPAGARLLFVESIAKAAVGFFLHGGIVDKRAAARKPKKKAPALQCVDADHGPSSGPRRGLRSRRQRGIPGAVARAISRASATSTGCFAPARGVYNYVINHPDDIKRVLLSNHRNYTKGEGMDRVKILLGNGIMTSEGDFWRRQRRMMQPAFHRRVIDQFSALIREVNEKFAAPLGGKSRARRAGQYHRRHQRTDPGDRAELDLRHGPASAWSAVRRESLRSRRQGAEPRPEVRVSIPFAHQAGGQLIERRRREPEEHFDFLAMLMAARDRETGAPMSDKELIDEVMTLIVAGHETTAAALTWTWYLISQHPRDGGALAGRSRPQRRWRARARRRRIPRVHPPGTAGGAAALSARLAVHAAHDRGGRARRLPHRGAHRRVHQPLHAAPAPGLLERTGAIPARAVCRGRRRRSATGSPTFRSRWARGTASARIWRCSRCWCTVTPCRGAFA